jgi:hypothetical protein
MAALDAPPQQQAGELGFGFKGPDSAAYGRIGLFLSLLFARRRLLP